MYALVFKPDFPIWASDSRIVRLSCPRYNDFAIRVGTSEISAILTAKSRIND
jgi:hypothetical protein